MWAIYRKRFPLVQAMFLAICLIMRWGLGRPWSFVGIVFAFLQISAVLGAWWAYRLERYGT